MSMKKPTPIQWPPEPEPHDYPAAGSYLNLIFDDATVATMVKKLKRAPMNEFKSKDIFRASGLALLGTNNWHVARNLRKIERGDKLSPLLLIRDSARGRVLIADGYHRLCAVYTLDEDAVIPCKIA